MWVRAYGWLEYNPTRPELKKKRIADDWWVVVNVPGHIAQLYGWFVQRRYGIPLQTPVWRSHITALNGRVCVQSDKRHLWKKYHGEKIWFEYSVDVENHWRFWVLPIRCERIQEIREELNMGRNNKLHITIGREYDINPYNEQVIFNGM